MPASSKRLINVDLPEELLWGTAETTLGTAGLILGPRGVKKIALPQPSEALTVERLGLDDSSSIARNQAALEPWLERIAAALRGEVELFEDWPLDWRGTTPFQRAIWTATRQIPWGQTRSYWWVAVRAGNPRAARAVGQAMGANPIPIVVPCHRVIRADGQLGGFGGGVDLKRQMLKVESATI